MSQYQNKGDRSEGQLKKTGRSSGPGHQRSGVPSSAGKGGGAGGPSPSSSAPPVPAASLGGVQSTAAAPSSRPTTPASSTGRGGKRANVPAGAARSASSGTPVEYGGNYKAPPYAGPHYQNQPPQPQPQQQAVVRQGSGPADVNQHPATNAGQQSEMKQITRGSISGGAPLPVPKQPYVVGPNIAPGAAARPPPPSLSGAIVVGSEPVSPVATTASSVDMSRGSLQPAFSFQFGSITPGFTGMQIPARTSSAPPNLDEQKREQARFEASRGIAASKVPTVPTGPPQGQVARGVGNAGEAPASLQQNPGTQGQGGASGVQSQLQQPGHPPGMAQQPVQYSQGQVHPVPLQGHQISQSMHIPGQVQVSSQQLHIQMAAQAQAQAQAHQAQAQAQAQAHQAQAHAQHQVLAQQTLPQQALPQQGMVQQSLSQGMKFPQSMMTAPHGAQMISQQMGNPMAGQLSGQQVPPQMAHQLGPQMGGAMGGQLPPGITAAQYGPSSNHITLHPPRSRAVKIVHPETHEELRFEQKTKKGDSFMDTGPPTSASISAGLPVRVTSNGPPQTRAPVNYGSGPHHTMVSNMSYFQTMQSGGYAAPPYFQSVPPPKSGVSTAGGPPANTPGRYPYGPQTPFLSHPGAVATPPGTKIGPPGGLGITLTTSEITTAAPSSPLVVSPIGGPPPPPTPAVVTSAQVVPARAGPPSQPGGNPSPSSNGRASNLVSSPASGNNSVPVSPIANPMVAFKFGDVDESGSTITVPGTDSFSENISSASIEASPVNGSSSTGGDNNSAAQNVQASDGSSSRRDVGSRGSTAASPATTPKPAISVPLSKSGTVPSGLNVSSPKVASGLSATSGEKLKVENSKPTISRENSANSRKLSKREKAQRNQQQQQQQSPTVSLAGDIDGEVKGDSLNSTSITAGNAGVGTEKVSTTSLKVALQRSHSGVQSSSGSQAAVKTTAAGKSEEVKGTPKASTDLERRMTGKLSVSSSNPESVNSVQVVSSEAEDSVRKLTTKQASGRTLAPSKSMEGKDSSSSAISAGKATPVSKSSSSKSLAVTFAGKEASVVGEPPFNTFSVGKSSLNIEATKEVDNTDSGESSTVGSEICTSQQVEDCEVRNSSTSANVVSAEPPITETADASGEEDLTRDVPKSPTESWEHVKPGVDAPQSDEVTSTEKDGESNVHLNGTSVVESTSAFLSEGFSDLELATAKERSSGPVDDDKVDGTTPDPVSIASQQVTEDKEILTEAAVPANVVENSANVPSIPSAAESDRQSLLRSEKILLVEVVAKEKETSEDSADVLVSYHTIGLERTPSKGVTSGGSLDSSTIAEPRKPKYKPTISVNVDSLPEASDCFVSSNHPLGGEGAMSSVEKTRDVHRPESSGSAEEYTVREVSENLSISVQNTSVEHESASSVVPELRPSNSKKKKKKEIFAKADAQGPTADLFTAYKAPEEKRLDDQVKRSEVTGSSNPGGDLKKDSSSTFEKPVLKELEDWEDAVELPTPKITPGGTSSSSDFNVVSSETPNPGSGVKRYTRDFLMSQQKENLYLLADESQGDLADILKSRDGHPGDALPSPSGRPVDRQLGVGRGSRPSNVGPEEDRWTRGQQASVSSPGRGPPDGQMGMGGPPGGFRPGQGRPGLMGMPPVMRPGMVPGGGVISMGPGLLPGNSLLQQHNMMAPPSSAPGRPMSAGGTGGGIDADRWQRAPQKGLIPSPRTPLSAIHKTENRYQVGRVSDEEEQKQRLVKAILNKLTPQNFEKLFAQVKEVHIDSATTLTGVISQIFDKALTEPTFCEMYAKFCVKLADDLPEFVKDEEKITFKRVLLNKCQEEFERGEREQEEAEKSEEEGEVKLSEEEREEKRIKARRRMLGNIRFIGELYKKNMLTERIMHECIKKLLGEYQNPDEEDVEALCKLMSTIGHMIDHQKAKEHIDTYFRRMDMLSENMKLSSRLRFMLKDVIDLRRNGWQERRKVDGPKRIEEVHRDALQERQPAGSGRDRLPQRGGIASGGGRRPSNDFSIRGPQPSMYSQGGPMVGNMPISSLRGPQPPPGAMRGGFGQDVRMEDRLMLEGRPVPLSQRPSDDVPLTLTPQGGLGRPIGGPSRGGPPIGSGRSALADVPPMSFGEARRPGMGPMPGFGAGMISDRGPYAGREDSMAMRGAGAERPLGSADRPLLERPMGPERLGPTATGRDMRAPDRLPERPRTPYGSSSSMRPVTPPAALATRHSPVVPHVLSEDDLKKKSRSTILEFYSARDFGEATSCVEDLKSPKFHTTMVSMWITDALEKKDIERERLMELIVHLRNKTGDAPIVTSDHIFKGFEIVLTTLDDIIVDVPRALEYVAGMFVKLIAARIFTLPQVGSLLREGGMDPGSLLDSGYALIMFGSVLDTFRREKGEEEMIAMYRNSGLPLEDFLGPAEKKRASYFESFLERKNLQCLYPMIPVESYLREAMDRDEPVGDIVKWLEKNVPQATWSDPAFLRLIMKQVLRRTVPIDNNKVAPHFEKSMEGKIKKYSILLKRFATGRADPLIATGRANPLKATEASQRQYIVAVQLFANDVGHPTGLVTALFKELYREEVITERVFHQWQDDVKDLTPGRAEAIKDTFKWFQWLDEAPEDGEDEEDSRG